MLFGNVRSRRGVGCVRLESGGALGAPFLPGADANQPVLQPGGGEGGGNPFVPTITSPGTKNPGGGTTNTKSPLRVILPGMWLNPNSPPIISTPPMPPPLTAQPPLQPGTSPTEPYVPPPIDTSPPPPPGSSATDVTPTVEVLPAKKPWWPWALAAAAAAVGAAVFATR